MRKRTVCFSALQRAENSSMSISVSGIATLSPCFSALQRAENSSMELEKAEAIQRLTFQCSSASRKFLNVPAQHQFGVRNGQVSVLFSEPKIPQFRRLQAVRIAVLRFSALQRAENSSIIQRTRAVPQATMFQCSSASRKFLNAASA